MCGGGGGGGGGGWGEGGGGGAGGRGVQCVRTLFLIFFEPSVVGCGVPRTALSSLVLVTKSSHSTYRVRMYIILDFTS